MKHVRGYDSWKRSKKSEKVNEELLGGLLNFFKNMWNKATEELKKLGDNPSTKDIDTWIETKIFNPADANYIFKSVIDEFKKKTEANTEDCLTLVSNILDPETGALGKQGLQPLYDSLIKVYGKNLGPLETIKFYFQKARNRAIKDYKFGGGPDLKIGDEAAKIDPNLKKMDIADTTHLPDFKKVLQGAGEDNKKKKEVALGWVEKTLTPRLLKYIQEVKPEEVDEYLKSKNIKSESSGMDYAKLKEIFDKKQDVIYKRKEFKQDLWDKLPDDQKKNPTSEEAKKLVGVKKMEGLDDTNTDKSVKFSGEDGKTFEKGYSDIIGPVEEKAEGQDELVKKLGDMKSKKPEDIAKVGKFVDFISDEANKDKVAEIEKIIGGESQGA